MCHHTYTHTHTNKACSTFLFPKIQYFSLCCSSCDGALPSPHPPLHLCPPLHMHLENHLELSDVVCVTDTTASDQHQRNAKLLKKPHIYAKRTCGSCCRVSPPLLFHFNLPLLPPEQPHPSPQICHPLLGISADRARNLICAAEATCSKGGKGEGCGGVPGVKCDASLCTKALRIFHPIKFTLSLNC